MNPPLQIRMAADDSPPAAGGVYQDPVEGFRGPLEKAFLQNVADQAFNAGQAQPPGVLD